MGCAALCAGSADCLAQAAASPISTLKALGHDRYQIGKIIVDKAAHRLVVPAEVAHLGEAPLEYVAVTKDGLKAYETLLEAGATGSEMNLALILLGFDSANSSHLAFQFDRNLPSGQTATVRIRWRSSQGVREVSADEALLSDEQLRTLPPAIWVYLGSFINPPDGRFGADTAGTLIGFVHDPHCLIEHRLGLGIGAYGSVRGNAANLPPIGSPVEIIVTATGQRAEPAPPPPPGQAPGAPPASP